jgi:septal ring factor EnvC (AmiA/AmiB activator)
MLLSLEEDLEKIKELENTIKENDKNFEKIKEILNKYESDINCLKVKLADIQEMSKVLLCLIMVSYSHNNPLNNIIFSIMSGFLLYKSILF